MPKILIETAPDQFQGLDGLALESSLDQLADLINQIGKDKLGNLELDEVTMSIKVSAQGEVILLNQSAAAGAMTLKFKRSYRDPNPASHTGVTSHANQVISTQISYQKLENLLANGQWQEANLETWNLLCTALHKNQGTPLTAADIEQIPCSSFNNIDKLWHRYSDGKFGFSVQSRIYKES
jgi:hypothetical protein